MKTTILHKFLINLLDKLKSSVACSLLILFTISFHSINANNKIDSLLKLAAKSNEVDKCKLFTAVAKKFLSTSSDSSLKYALKAYTLAEELNFKDTTYKCIYQVSYAYVLKSEYDNANKYAEELIQRARKNKDVFNEANGYFNLGLSADYKGDFEIANNNYYTALKLFEKINNQEGIAKCYTNIGIVHYYNGVQDKAIEFYKKALQIAEQAKLNDIKGNLLNNIASVFYQKRQLDSALVYYFKSVEETKKQPSASQNIATMYGNIGLVYEEQGDFTNSEKYHHLALDLHEQMKNVYGIATTLKDIGKMYVAKGEYEKAIEYLNKSLKISEETGTKQIHETIYKHLAAAYAGKKDFANAYEAYKKHNVLKDSIINDRNRKTILEIEAKYGNEKKQKEIELLNEKQHKQDLINYGIGFFVLFLAAFIYLLYKRLKITRIQNKIIEHQKLEVESKNIEITDSITYAKRIQEAILPPISFIEKHLPDSFVLYQPKDIVAGDFYWMEVIEQNNSKLILIAAADCTGHGVPGALVSVVCSNALNRAVNEFSLHEPGDILTKTRELVLETFAKSASDVKDGMDISLLAIHYNANELRKVIWSGANNPLWYFTSDTSNPSENEVKEVKAHKQAIGKTENPTPFPNHELKLKTGDCIYLITDGYADQFGGEKGKKFKYKALSDLLIRTQKLSMFDQQKELEKVFDTWKGSLEQVDDVTIIGIRL